MSIASLRKSLIAVGVTALVSSALAMPVLAQDWHGDRRWDDHERHEREWREHEWREHHYAPPPVIYAPPPAYAVVPPPVVVGAPGGINIVLPIRIR